MYEEGLLWLCAVWLDIRHAFLFYFLEELDPIKTPSGLYRMQYSIGQYDYMYHNPISSFYVT